MALDELTTPLAAPGWAPVPAVDRLWVGNDTVIVVGPVELPSLAELRAAVAVLARASAPTRVGQRLDVAASRWVPTGLGDDELGRRLVLVHEGPGPREVGLGAFARAAAARRPADVPVVWVVAGDHLALSITHAAGDLGLMGSLLTGVWHAAATGRPPADLERPATASPLRTALAHHYRGHPDRVLATLRAVRPLSGRAAGVGGPTTTVAPSQTAVEAVSAPAAVDALAAWRKEHAPGVSTAALQVVLVHRALSAAGLPPTGSPFLLFDARRYLPRGSVVHGNFVAGLDVPVDEGWSLTGLDAAITATVDAARPLSAIAAGVAGRAARERVARLLGRGGGAAPHQVAGMTVPAAPRRPRVTVTVLGRPAGVVRLPWTAPPGQRLFASMSTPAPAGITVATTALPQQAGLSMSFHDTVFDRDVLQAVADRIAADPVGVLREGTDGSSGSSG